MSRKAWTACGRLSARPHLKVSGSLLTAGGTTSAVLGWSGGSSVVHHVYLLVNHLLSPFFDCTAVSSGILQDSHICPGLTAKSSVLLASRYFKVYKRLHTILVVLLLGI